jgi:hypothetical protein
MAVSPMVTPNVSPSIEKKSPAVDVTDEETICPFAIMHR